MKRWLLLLVLCAGCAPKSLSPQGQIAYTADQIVLRLGELQAAVIAACGAGGGSCVSTAPIRTDQARAIVQVVDTSVSCLKAAPAGWQACAGAAWKSARLTAVFQAPEVQGYVQALNTLLGVQ